MFGMVARFSWIVLRIGKEPRMKSLAHFFGASLGLLVLAGMQARAEPIGWDFSWEPSSLVIPADGGGI